MLTYIITEAFETLDTAENSEATVEAQRTLTYTSEQGGGRSSITHIIVKGKVAEKNITYPVTWEFLWPDDNVVQLQTALSEIHNYVRPNNSPMENPSHNHKEVAVEVYDWLKVGWVEENRVG